MCRFRRILVGTTRTPHLYTKHVVVVAVMRGLSITIISVRSRRAAVTALRAPQVYNNNNTIISIRHACGVRTDRVSLDRDTAAGQIPISPYVGVPVTHKQRDNQWKHPGKWCPRTTKLAVCKRPFRFGRETLKTESRPYGVFRSKTVCEWNSVHDTDDKSLEPSDPKTWTWNSKMEENSF